MNPPAKASSANRADSRSDDRRATGPRPRRRADPVVGVGAARPAPRRPARAAERRRPSTSPMQRVADDDRPVGVDSAPSRPPSSAWLSEPGRQRPDRRRDVARRGCTRRTSRVRRASGHRSRLSAACSTARNGPTSLPVGLMTPIVAARIRSGTPARERERRRRRATISSAPDDEDPPAADPVGVRRQPERDQRVADEGQREDHPDRRAGRGRAPPGTGRGRPRGSRSRTSGGRSANSSRPSRSRPRRLAIEAGRSGRGRRVHRVASLGFAPAGDVCQNAGRRSTPDDDEPATTPTLPGHDDAAPTTGSTTTARTTGTTTTPTATRAARPGRRRRLGRRRPRDRASAPVVARRLALRRSRLGARAGPARVPAPG